MWVGDVVGGLLGADKGISKAHPQAPSRQDEDEVQHETSAQGFIFWNSAFQFPGSPERLAGVPEAI